MVHRSRIWRPLSKLAAWLRRARGHTARQLLRADGIIRCIRQCDCNSRLQATALHRPGFVMAQIGPVAPLPKTANGSVQSPRSGDGNRAKQSPRSGDGNRAKPSPNSGDGNGVEPSPESGDGAVSNLRGEPSPIWRPSRLQPTGEKPVINQERTSARERSAPFLGPTLGQAAVPQTGAVEVGTSTTATVASAGMATPILRVNLVTQSHLSKDAVELLTTRSERGQHRPTTDPDRVMVVTLSPEFGDGKQPEPSPESGEGAFSNLRGEPSPIWGPSLLQPTGEKPVINQKRTSAPDGTAPDHGFTAPPATDGAAPSTDRVDNNPDRLMVETPSSGLGGGIAPAVGTVSVESEPSNRNWIRDQLVDRPVFHSSRAMKAEKGRALTNRITDDLVYLSDESLAAILAGIRTTGEGTDPEKPLADAVMAVRLTPRNAGAVHCADRERALKAGPVAGRTPQPRSMPTSQRKAHLAIEGKRITPLETCTEKPDACSAALVEIGTAAGPEQRRQTSEATISKAGQGEALRIGRMALHSATAFKARQLQAGAAPDAWAAACKGSSGWG